ncbi:hypothetical protein H1C71_000198, partial [Ictidomys tridecemlineatus]
MFLVSLRYLVLSQFSSSPISDSIQGLDHFVLRRTEWISPRKAETSFWKTPDHAGRPTLASQGICERRCPSPGSQVVSSRCASVLAECGRVGGLVREEGPGPSDRP